jgi:hypothetical protein
MIQAVILELSRSLTRFISGKLLTEEQIKGVSANIFGKHFIGLFPPPLQEVEAKQRVELAREHINAASTIILDLQQDLASQADELEKVSKEIEEKKTLADRYAALATVNQQAVQAFRAEMEEAIRIELAVQASKGKSLRRGLTLTGWLLTLILGAALGTYFKEVIAFLRSVVT